jgi:hypothetical protein
MSALLLLASIGGCQYGTEYGTQGGAQYLTYHANAAAWNAAAVERPQRVRFYYGYVVDVRPDVRVAYAAPKSGSNWEPAGREVAQVAELSGAGPSIPLGARVLGQPNLQAAEYTVMLDKSTMPADEFLRYSQHPAIVVVQDIPPTEAPLFKGERVVVRVMGDSAHVLAAAALPAIVGNGINVEQALSAGPMPVPLGYRPPPPVPTISMAPCGTDQRPCNVQTTTVSTF